MSRLLTIFSLLLLVGAQFIPRDASTDAPDARDTRYFKIDKHQKVIGSAAHLTPELMLQLVSVTVDQPQFWPDETVRVRVMMPGRASQRILISWNKRDATPKKLTAELDEAGLAVVQLADGKQDRLQLGEYRVDVTSLDTKAKGTSTFAVVEGTLGTVSLAYEFERVTSTAQLDQVKAGWFMGNASGAGQRWGNGLSFKNQLRVDNQPFDGEVEIVPRCMLSGCNGIVAGPKQKFMVSKGELAATVQINGHSGPFQIEIITDRGSLRHQFEGSGHVEREMLLVSKGVHWQHRVSLAPYEGTKQLTGRALWADRLPQASESDAFDVEQLQPVDGKMKFVVRVALEQAAVLVYSPKANGTFEATPFAVPEKLAKGDVVQVPVSGALSLIAIGGKVSSGPTRDQFVEGYVMGFAPSDLVAKIVAPEKGSPFSTVRVELQIRDTAGAPVATSGLLEAYDIRVAAKDAAGPLASAVGDSVRSSGRHINSWVDPIELERQRIAEEKRRKDEEKQEKLEQRREQQRQKKEEQDERRRDKVMEKAARSPSKDGIGGLGIRGSGVGGGGQGYGYASGSGSAAPKMMVGRAGSSNNGGHHHGEEEEELGEQVREGEVKITYVAIVKTDKDGHVFVDVPTPPQTGRLALRFTPVRGLSWTQAVAQVDVQRVASVEAQVPRLLVAGGELDLQIVTQNQSESPLTLQIKGAGLAQPIEKPVASGKQHHVIAWPAQAGELQMQLTDEAGKIVDKRLYKIADVAKQKVTWSRLELGGNKPVALQPGTRAIIYKGPGELMGGIVTNMLTTMESWFPHAEALSAKVAVTGSLLAAIQQKILVDDGYTQVLRGSFENSLTLLQQLYDPQTQMLRPFPGLPPNARWTAWAAGNLQIAKRSMKLSPQLRANFAAPIGRLEQLCKDLDAGFAARHEKVAEVAGYDPQQDGLDVVEIEVDGQVRFSAVTDDAVQKFVIEELVPALDPVDGANEAELGKALDKFRFARAFERVGRLQWLVGQAKAAFVAGDKGKPAFDKLFGIVARGFILSQEPGMIQGPALLGGVYSQPMALPRFVELLLLMGSRPAQAGNPTFQIPGLTLTVKYAQPVEVTVQAKLTLPSGAIVRIDKLGEVDLRAPIEKPFVTATVSAQELKVGQQGELVLTLAPDQDPLEFYALIAVPTTVGIKQTEDALSDYKGQLIYGQQAMGSGKMQMIAVPFRGSRTMRLLIEGLLPGQAPGLVAIRHVHDTARACAVNIPAIRVPPGG